MYTFVCIYTFQLYIAFFQEPDVQDSNYGYEGSGGGGYGDEDIEDNFDDGYNVDDGSGGYVEENEFNDNNKQIENSYNSNQGSIYNNNQNSYNNVNNGFNQDYSNNNNGYNQNNVDGGGGGQDYNSQYNNFNNYAPSTKAVSYLSGFAKWRFTLNDLKHQIISQIIK